MARCRSVLCTYRIGKVKAAFHLAEAIRQVEPDIVINMGTAGTIHHKVGDIFVCRHFIDRDMQKLAGLGLSYQLDTSACLNRKGSVSIGRSRLPVIPEIVFLQSY